MEVLQNLDPLLRTFWYIAFGASIVFVIQTLLTFIGADSSDGIGADFNGDFGDADAPFQLFSLRNLIHFLLGFGWTGVSLYSSISQHWLLISAAVLVGALFILMFFFIIKNLEKLAENNSFKINDTLNQTAEVYLSIPEHKSGKGKVMISVKGSFHELEAITEHDRIPTGAVVKVVRIENNTILVVETL